MRAASKLLRPFNPALGVEPFAAQQVADCGDIAVNPFDINEAITTIEASITDLRRDGSTVLTIGGDHTIALPILRSLARDHGKIAVRLLVLVVEPLSSACGSSPGCQERCPATTFAHCPESPRPGRSERSRRPARGAMRSQA